MWPGVGAPDRGLLTMERSKPMSKSVTRGKKTTPTDDSTDAQITGPHFDRDATGDGYEYFRCEACALESSDPNMDTRGCPRCTGGPHE